MPVLPRPSSSPIGKLSRKPSGITVWKNSSTESCRSVVAPQAEQENEFAAREFRQTINNWFGCLLLKVRPRMWRTLMFSLSSFTKVYPLFFFLCLFLLLLIMCFVWGFLFAFYDRVSLCSLGCPGTLD